MKLKDSLTILIPLWGRDYATKRILEHMSSTGVPFKILLADGGGSDQSSRINSENYPNLNLEYQNYGSDSSIHDFHRKMDLACSSITTPLTIMIDNDDFVSVDGLSLGIKFLSSNRDFSSFRENIMDLGSQKPMYTRDNPVSSYTKFSRVLGLFGEGEFNSAWHDICRTPCLKMFFRIINLSGSQDFQLSHSLNKYWSLFYGKMHRGYSLPFVYHTPGDSLVQGKNLYSKYRQWPQDPKFPESMAIISSAIKTIFREEGCETIREIQELIINHPCVTGGFPPLKNNTINGIINSSNAYHSIMEESLIVEDPECGLFSLDSDVEVFPSYEKDISTIHAYL